jgi:hypothetical protein
MKTSNVIEDITILPVAQWAYDNVPIHADFVSKSYGEICGGTYHQEQGLIDPIDDMLDSWGE